MFENWSMDLFTVLFVFIQVFNLSGAGVFLSLVLQGYNRRGEQGGI